MSQKAPVVFRKPSAEAQWAPPIGSVLPTLPPEARVAARNESLSRRFDGSASHAFLAPRRPSRPSPSPVSQVPSSSVRVTVRGSTWTRQAASESRTPTGTWVIPVAPARQAEGMHWHGS